MALAGCNMSREDLARELSRMVGEEISVHTVNNWCAEGKNNRRFPLEYAAALAVITGSRQILDAAIRVAGFRVLDSEESAYFELGVIEAQERKRRKEKAKIIERIGI